MTPMNGRCIMAMFLLYPFNSTSRLIMPFNTLTVFAGMDESQGGSSMSMIRGFLWGLAGISAATGILLLVDLLVQQVVGQPLFRRPHTMALLVLATTIILFRMQIKKGQFELGKGFFLAVFLSSIAYLIFHKYATGS
jgi:hypothetical protein